MKVSTDKYSSIMGEFVELMDSINLEIPAEIKPFYSLYKQIKDNPDIDETLFEDSSILEGLQQHENNCTYLVKHISNTDFEARLLLFVPAAKIKDFPNKMLFSEYRVVVSYNSKDESKLVAEKHMILNALADNRKIVDLFKYVSKFRKIILRDATLDEFYTFQRSVNGEEVIYTKTLDLGSKSDGAQEALTKAESVFEKIIMELRVGLGVV